MVEPTTVMRCHYETMEVNMSCTLEDIKKQYKKLALKWHPDRNHNQVELATKNFKEIAAAYAVLSDAQERKWYDDHREAILRGGDGTSGGDDNDSGQKINLWKYFNATCFSGFDDTNTGFFSVYQVVFDRINSQEFEYIASGSSSVPDNSPPSFGTLSSVSSVFLSFYSYWENFVSKLSFSWEDKYNVLDAPNRQTKRAMEKENQKFRDIAKKEFTNLVRSLTLHVKKRDVRYTKFEEEVKQRKLEEEERKVALKSQETERRKAAREQAMAAEQYTPEELAIRANERKSAFLLADNDSDLEDANGEDITYSEAELQNKIRELKLNDGVIGTTAVEETTSEDDAEQGDEQQEEFNCDVCSKSFKSEAQLNQHLSSKVHRKKAQELQKKVKVKK